MLNVLISFCLRADGYDLLNKSYCTNKFVNNIVFETLRQFTLSSVFNP